MSIVSLSIAELINRDLDRLSTELKSYSKEENIWKVEGEITNSAGNLALHLCGNLQHFIGAILGKTGYERNREFEFSGKNVAREALIQSIEDTKKAVTETLERMPESSLNYPFPIKVFGDKEMSTVFFLVHLQGHLNYHLGQVNYHRRLLDK